MKFTITELKVLYETYHEKHGKYAYQYISDLLREAKKHHKKAFLIRKPNGDHEQSWRAFKGKNLEKLIEHLITKNIEDLGLKVINGNRLERLKVSECFCSPAIAGSAIPT